MVILGKDKVKDRKLKKMSRTTLRFWVPVLLAGMVSTVIPTPAQADLRQVKESDGDAATFVGRGGYTADGLGQNGVGGLLQAEVPSGSSVVRAYLYGSYFFVSLPIPQSQRTLNFDGSTVILQNLNHSGESGFLAAARADVTNQVAAKVGSGGGITNFAVNSDPPNLDGVALVVLFSNPTLPHVTIAVMDGGAKQTGDSVAFQFATPINKSIPGFSARMSLGIGFGFQGSAGHACGFGQFSTVDVNGKRLTSCAGNYDDGFGNNGALITVGGVGDAANNPANPNAIGSGEDDELYDLAPLLNDGDSQAVIKTANPSRDDLVFLAIISIAGVGAAGCGPEDGLQTLEGSPAQDLASGTLHSLEPTVDSATGNGELLHAVNCTVIVPAESTVDATPLPAAAPVVGGPGSLNR